jgi:hypothetical protein
MISSFLPQKSDGPDGSENGRARPLGAPDAAISQMELKGK